MGELQQCASYEPALHCRQSQGSSVQVMSQLYTVDSHKAKNNADHYNKESAGTLYLLLLCMCMSVAEIMLTA